MINRLKEVLMIQSESFKQWRMFAYLVRKLTALDVNFYVLDGCIYATKGKADVYPCIVAHMDTVHSITSDLSILQVGDNLTGFNRVTMTQTGIGGDDKVGIYLALECLMKYDNIKVAFFRDEEVGCHGSYDAYMQFFEDCSFVLQGDRRGNSDFVTNASGVQLSSKAFRKAIGNIVRSHGYKFGDGMMTDVMALKENGLNVSCANISCGYYNPHCKNEYVNVTDVENCLNMICEIIDKHGSTVFKHNPEKRMWSTTKVTNKWDGWDDEYDYRKDFKEDVWKGFKPFEDDEIDYVWDDKKGEYVQTFNNTPVINYCDCCHLSKPLTFVPTYNAYLCNDCEKEFV